MIELKVLQAVRLKGRVIPDDVAGTVDASSKDVADTLRSAVEAGLLIEGKTVRLSEQGRSRLAELLTAERGAIDPGVIAAAYDDFRVINADFKAVVSDWQLKNGEPNAHDDKAYDAGVLDRLGEVHERVTPLIATVAGQLPRLGHYSTKLSTALEKVRAGETIWLTRPIVDSYHTVWFELHEELILAAGLTRQAEAEAGHAN
jgi:hypothetical protein